MLSTKDLFTVTFLVFSYQEAANKNDHQTSSEINILVDEPVKSTDYALRYLLPPQIQICNEELGNNIHHFLPLLNSAQMKAAGLQQLCSETVVSVSTA